MSEASVSTIPTIKTKQLKLRPFSSRHLAHNPASGKVMSKAGMVQEGYLRQDMIRYGRVADMVVFGLLRSEWESKKK